MRWIGAMLGLCLLLLTGAALGEGLTRFGTERQTGLAAETARLRQQAGDLRSRIAFWQAAGAALTPPDGIARRSRDETGATLAVQKALVALGAETGLTLSTFGAAPTPERLSLPVAAVELEASGPIGAVAQFLAGLEAVTPRLAISHLTIRAAPGGRESRGAALVTVRLVVWGFWQVVEET